MLFYFTQEAVEINTSHYSGGETHALNLRTAAFWDGIMFVWQSSPLGAERLLCTLAALTVTIPVVASFASTHLVGNKSV